MAVTMQDIADRVHVCRAVVSAVLNGKKDFRVSDQTRERILAVAHELSYHKNILAASTRTGIVRTLAVITSFSNKYPAMIDGIIDAAMESGFDIKIFSDENVAAAVASIIENRITCVISLSSDPEKRKELADCASLHSLNVLFHFDTGPLPFQRLNMDFKVAAEKSAEYLIGLGHRRIAAVCGPIRQEMIYKRKYLDAFRKAMKHAGLEILPEYIDEKRDFQDHADTLLAMPPGKRPTAICCIADAIAYYIFRAAAQRKIKLPEELSVIGYGNFPYSELAFVSLTTWEEFQAERGRLSVQLLLGKTQMRPDADGCFYVKPKLIVRDSAVPVPYKAKRGRR